MREEAQDTRRYQADGAEKCTDVMYETGAEAQGADAAHEAETKDRGADSYADIIGLAHPEPKNHPRMPMENRAAQFAPFAALSGFEEAVEQMASVHAERVMHRETNAASTETD